MSWLKRSSLKKSAVDEFTTEVDLSVSGHPRAEEETITRKVPVKWSAEIEMRDWGIKGIFVYASDQVISYVVEKYDTEGNVVGEEDRTFSLTSENTKTDTSGIAGIDQIAPYELIIDLKNNTASLEF